MSIVVQAVLAVVKSLVELAGEWQAAEAAGKAPRMEEIFPKDQNLNTILKTINDATARLKYGADFDG